MLKQRVVYTGFDGEQVEEDLYFNLSRLDLIELNQKYGNKDMVAYIDEVVKNKDVFELYSILKDIVLKAYGVRSDDGKRFIRNDKAKEEFLESLAFAQLIEDFHENDKALNNFIINITSSIKGIDEAMKEL